MLKFLIIMTLVIYLIFKVGQFLFRVLILGAGGQEAYRRQQQNRQQHSTHQRKKGVSIDYVPDDRKNGGQSGYQGGEYVDYEEVK
jgi:hypothetical protein